MSYLLRVQLPDVPGSLGRLATAIGAARGNIDAIEIVSRDDGFAVDDVFLVAEQGVMPDSIVSAVQAIEGMSVLWISRYAAGSNVFLDLEAVESMTEEPQLALQTLVQLAPTVFRADWGLHVRRRGQEIEILDGTSAAPTTVPDGVNWPEGDAREVAIDDLLLAGSPSGDHEAVVIARRGGPGFLPSELARLDHLVGLARSISRHA